MAAYTGVGTRIREQMMKLGYVRTDGEPDVQRFSWDFRYDRRAAQEARHAARYARKGRKRKKVG